MVGASSHADSTTVLISGHRSPINSIISIPETPGIFRSMSTRSGRRRSISWISSGAGRASPTTSHVLDVLDRATDARDDQRVVVGDQDLELGRRHAVDSTGLC